MEKKRILILGGGISGLSFAWSFSRLYPEVECILIEKEKRAGGYMEGEIQDGFSIEKGPRIFKTSRNEEFLTLLEEADLLKYIIPSSKEAKTRYIREKGSFHKISPFSPYLWPLWKSLCKEPFIPYKNEEETISGFAERRFGKEVAERFFDPLTLGIYASDYRELSLSACFPILKEFEKEGGILRSFLKRAFQRKKKRKQRVSSSLFSFEGGSSSILEKLIEKMACTIEYGQEATSLIKEGEKWVVVTREKRFEGDMVVLTVPAFVAASLVESSSSEMADLLRTFPYQDVTSISIGWKEDLMPFSGFGYLIPQSEKEPILGVLFDSKIFPRSQKYSLISLLIGDLLESKSEIQESIDHVCKTHLQIEKEPDCLSYKKMEKAIPKYLLGHREKVERLKKLAEEIPGLYLTGNYMDGVSVNDCCKQSRKLALKIGL